MNRMFDAIENDCNFELYNLFRQIHCVDFIGPREYFDTMIPRRNEFGSIEYFYKVTLISIPPQKLFFHGSPVLVHFDRAFIVAGRLQIT